MPISVPDACVACFAEHEHNCSGFVTAVAGKLGVPFKGLANEMVETLRAGGAWTRLANGAAAQAAAAAGKLVIGGLKGSEQARPDAHGHVVVVIDGPLARGAYPSAYWGSLGGKAGRDQTVNFAWTQDDRDKVTYASHELPAAQERQP